MDVKIVHDRNLAYECLKDKERYNYIYQFNNLEANKWNRVICYGLFKEESLVQIAMLNADYSIPVLLAASFGNSEYNKELIGRIRKFLPPEFYTHMDKDTLEAVFPEMNVRQPEELMNMGLVNSPVTYAKAYKEVVRLGYSNINEIKQLISESYPDAWLDDELVKLGENFGSYDNGRLISFAGIHAYSEQYQVAAVAHVTTLPEYRGRGYAGEVVNELIRSLAKRIAHIGLNVRTDNTAAINCYKRLGFQDFGSFIACEISNNGKQL